MDGLRPVAAGHVATVVTRLEMTARPPFRPLLEAPLTLRRWATPGTAAYRTLFARVGGPWLWFSRLAMDDARLATVLAEPMREVHVVLNRAGIEVGLLELDFAQGGTCTIAYFALVPELTGRGHGGWLMARAMALAWRPRIGRVAVDTCTLDHPRALGFYRHQGFVAVARRVEVFPDPRLAGLLPQDAAPHVPIV